MLPEEMLTLPCVPFMNTCALHMELVSKLSIAAHLVRIHGHQRKPKAFLQEGTFYSGKFYSDFLFFFDRFLIILGGEGGCLDRFFNRLLIRDPASEVCSVQR